MKKLLTGLGVIAFAIVLVMLAVSGLDYVLSDDVKAYTRLIMHDMYKEDKIDSIFLGTSHIYRGINPEITDEVWDENTFDVSSALQDIDGSLAMLKEAHKSADIDRCFFEISWRKVKTDKEERMKETTTTYIISDYMKPSRDKVSYLLDAVESKDYVNAFFRVRRNWKNIYSKETMKDIIARKRTDEYRNYGKTIESYAGKGFFPLEGKFSRVSGTGVRTITENYMSDDYRMYFEKIVDYCRENEIELICFVSPTPEYTMVRTKNYDSFVTQVKEVCDGYEVPFYDFNLANPSVLDLKDDDFMDYNHLNSSGADKFTQVFAEFFAGNITEEELFYSSYSEKQEHLPKRFLGLNIKRYSDEGICKVKAVSTKDESYLYEVFYQNADGEYELLQEKSKNREIKMPGSGKVQLKVVIYNDENQKIDEFEKKI